MNRQNSILRAINEKQFIPYIQPVINQHGSICGGEILARWCTEDKVVTPDSFINEIEDMGVMMSFTESIMDNFFTEIYRYAGSEAIIPDDFFITLNISPDLLMDEQIICFCVSVIDSMRSDMRLILEVTERKEFIVNKKSVPIINQLKSLGVQFALDDYGTGLSNLISLSCIDFDYIKIDKAFVKEINSCKKMLNIINNIMDLARRLNCQVIAEGVETYEQVTRLAMLDVKLFQGFYFCKPMNIVDFVGSVNNKILVVP